MNRDEFYDRFPWVFALRDARLFILEDNSVINIDDVSSIEPVERDGDHRYIEVDRGEIPPAFNVYHLSGRHPTLIRPTPKDLGTLRDLCAGTLP